MVLVAKTNNIQYAFNQWEWNNGKKWVANAGFRFDKNQNFASAFSPKFSLMYKVNTQLRFKLSAGRGFKAPDFRQLYLNFSNGLTMLQRSLILLSSQNV